MCSTIKWLPNLIGVLFQKLWQLLQFVGQIQVNQNKLLHQQVQGLEIQLQLVKQLTESKISEIKSLQIQIRLLEEKLI